MIFAGAALVAFWLFALWGWWHAFCVVLDRIVPDVVVVEMEEP